MIKKILSVLLALWLAFSALPAVASADSVTAVEKWSIALSDSIGASFYVQVPENTEEAVVNITLGESAQTQTVTPDEKGLCRVCVDVAAAQMTQDITLQLVADGVEYDPVSYTVRDYALHILSGNYSDDIKTLVRRMLNYGAAAQSFFGVNEDKPANADYALDYTAQYPAQYPEMTAQGAIDGLELYGAALVMDSKVAVRIYFTGSLEGVSFGAYEAVAKDDKFYVELPGILPQDYDKAITLTAAKGEETLTVTYSPLTYMVRMSQKGNAKTQTLVNAMYGYHQAATAYLEQAGGTLTMPNVSGGSIHADKTAFQWGDRVTLTATPENGYALKSLVLEKDGQAVDMGDISMEGGAYSFLAQDGNYTVTAEFAQPIFQVVSGNWDLSEQFQGTVTVTEKPGASMLITNACDYEEVAVTVKDYTPSKNANGSLKTGDFSMQFHFLFDDGMAYQVRIHNTDSDGNYKLQNMGGDNSLTGWKWQADLTTEQKQKLIDGDGVEFRVRLEAGNAQLYVDNTLMKTYALGDAYSGKTAQIKLCMNGNIGVTDMQIPYTLTKGENTASVTVPAFENGTVTADQLSYQIGDTVTLTVTPEEGYSQKLYINGEALLLDWKTSTYSFVATQSVYHITGSFEPSLNAVAKDEDRWDTANQAHGIMNAYYPDNSDAWLLEIQDEYQAITVIAKNYLAGEDGTGGEGFAVNIGFRFSNGKEFIFRVIRENNVYKYQRFGIGGSDWTKKNLSQEHIDAICGDGAEFRLERTGDSTLTLSVNGVVYDTYTMANVTQDNWVSAAIIGHYGNQGQKVSVPFTLEKPAVSEEKVFNSSELSRYVIVYDSSNPDYKTLADQLKTTIAENYGVSLSVVSESATKAEYEILVGDTNRDDRQSPVMAYSVTAAKGVLRINVGGSYSAEKAIDYLCSSVFTGQALALGAGEHYRTSLLTASRAVTDGATARVMSANILADAFTDADTYQEAYYRAELLAGMLVAYTPDVVGLQEADSSWSQALSSYLDRLEAVHGLEYSTQWATYEGKTNYTCMLYRSDKLKVENSGVEVFSWWKDLGANYNYHMRNISWAQFAFLEDSSKKFVVANTHWSYRTEHDGGDVYLTGASKPIATDELRTQCRDETKAFMAELQSTYSAMPVFLTGDFNTSLPYFTIYNWTPTSYNIISQQAKDSGTALSTVPISGHFDHLFGTGSYSVKCYEIIQDVNQHSLLTDHPLVYGDLSF